MKFTIATIMFLFFLSSLVLNAQTTSKIDGVVFADYYYNVDNNDKAKKNENAFQYRRIYFTFENNIFEDIKVRFRLESEHSGSSKINPFVKHAYLEWNNVIPNHKLYLGIAETNAFKNAEEYWEYRSIEKTIMDLNKICSSADMGIALKGDLTPTIHHWLTIMNGTGYGSAEVDKFKKVGYALWFTPLKGLIIEGYFDYEKQDPDNTLLSSSKDFSGSSGYNTLKAFAGYEQPLFTVGAETFLRTNKESGIKNVTVDTSGIISSDKTDIKRFGYSIFGSWITPIPKVKLFARYDYYDKNNNDDAYTKFDASTGALTGGLDDEETLLIAGLDYIPRGNIHIMPNIMLKSYTKEGKDSDITARITLYYKFDSGKIVAE
jgi:hypothetical protein